MLSSECLSFLGHLQCASFLFTHLQRTYQIRADIKTPLIFGAVFDVTCNLLRREFQITF